jgi:hypothetical protein
LKKFLFICIEGSERMLRNRYDFMRFAEGGGSDFELVVRAGDKVYDVYDFKVQMYPDIAMIYHRAVDLTRYTVEELDEWVSHWGYKNYPAFVDYLEHSTPVKNHELRLCSCITQLDQFFEMENILDADVDSCIAFLTERLEGRNPYDDSEDEDEATGDGIEAAEQCRC